MNKVFARVAVAVCLLAGVALSGCGSTGDPRPFSALQVMLSTPKQTYAQGEPVPLTLTIKNVSTQTVTLGYPGGPPFEFEVSRDGQVVFDSGRAGDAGIFQLTFAPGETRELSANALFWEQKDQAGNQVPAGQYSMTLWLIPGGINQMPISEQEARTRLSSNTVNITIQ